MGIDITPMTSRWIQDGAQNYGVTLQAGDETDHAYWKRFSSWEGGSSPLLFLSLGHRPGQASPQWPDDGKVLAAMTPKLTTLRAPDGDLDDPYYRFQVTTGAESSSPLVADSDWIPDPSFEIPPGVLVDGQSYFWRVYTADLKPRPDGMSEETYNQHIWNNPVFVTTPNWVRQFRVDMISGDITPNPNPTVPKPERFGTPDTSGYASDPVETSSGNFVHSEEDLAFAPGVFAMGYARTYNARDVLGSTLGQGWSGSYQSRLSIQDDGSVILREDDGRQRHFVANPDGSFVRPPEADFDLVRNGVGRYELIADDGVIQRFDGAGRLESITNWDGQTIHIARNGLGDVTSVQSSEGPTMSFTYGASRRLASITTNDGRAITYGYDTQKRLISVTDAIGGITRYTYDTQGRILTVVDPSGVVLVTNTYDALGRVVYQEGPNGSRTTFTYDTATLITTVTDLATGSATRYHHDVGGRLVAITDPYGAQLSKAYDAAGNLLGVVDRTGGNVNSIWPHCDGLKWPHPSARCSSSRRTVNTVSDGLV